MNHHCATPLKFQSLTVYEQVDRMKVELCRLLEEKRAAILRLVYFTVFSDFFSRTFCIKLPCGILDDGNMVTDSKSSSAVSVMRFSDQPTH